MSDRYAAWNAFVSRQGDDTIPHCDSRILHHHDDCEYCDRPAWTEARQALKVAFTGRDVPDGFVPCEADATRPGGASNDHRRWAGNKPTTAEGDPSWPLETPTSVMFYGDKGGRALWPLAERVRARATRPFRYARMRLRGWRRRDGFWFYGAKR